MTNGDVNYWWLRLVYAIRERDTAGEREALDRLARLGVKVEISDASSFFPPEAAAR